MGIGLALYFDCPVAEQFLDELHAAGLNTIRGQPGQVLHLSLINGDGGDLAALERAVTSLGPRLPAAVTLAEVACFPPPRSVAYFAIPADTQTGLATLHGCLLEACAIAGVTVRPFYRPPLWVPHISLATGVSPDQLPLARSRFADFGPLLARVTALGLATWTGKDVRIHHQWPNRS